MPHRLLTLEQVVEYLHLPKHQVSDMVRNDEIPHEKIGGRVIFRKIDLDAWASKKLLEVNKKAIKNMESFHQAASAKVHNLSAEHAIMPELMKSRFIHIDLHCRTRASLLRDLVELANQTGLLNYPDELLISLEEREEMASTALNGGVALPHPRRHVPYLFEDSFILLGRTIQPVHFGSPDNQRTDLFFLICCQTDDIHLHVLARLCMICYHTSLLHDLREAEDPEFAYTQILNAENQVILEKLSSR